MFNVNTNYQPVDMVRENPKSRVQITSFTVRDRS